MYLQNVKATSNPNPSTGETVTVNFDLKNGGETILANHPTVVQFYFDTDNNGVHSVPDQLLYTDTIKSQLDNNSINSFSSVFDVVAGKACEILVVLDTAVNACICDSLQAKVKVDLSGLAVDTAVCSSKTVQIGMNSINGYTYSWAPALGLSNAAISNPIFTAQSVNGIPDTSLFILTTDRMGCIHKDSINVIVSAAPHVGFSTSNICDYDTAKFVNNSSIVYGTITYHWEFGDDSTSSLQNPIHFYDTASVYITRLVATSQFGCKDSLSKQIAVSPAPTALFSVSNVCEYDSAIFTSKSTLVQGAITYNWDFDDNSTSILISPSHKYNQTKTYLPKLLVTSDSGCVDSFSLPIVIHSIPVSNFTFKDTCLNFTSKFNNTSTISGGNISTWNWDFGNLKTSNDTNPSHLYTAPGQYIRELIVKSDSGCTDTNTKAITIHPIPIADFTADSVCKNNITTFTDKSSVTHGNTIKQWIWRFNDNTPLSGLQNPTHLFADAKNHKVSLIVISDKGCVGISDTSLRAVVHPLPVADFVVDSVCENTPPTQFSDASTIASGKIQKWNWTFSGASTSIKQNPTVVFSSHGTYNTKLVVTSDFGCLDSIEKNNHVFPVPSAQFIADKTAGCPPLCVQFTDQTTIDSGTIEKWLWSLGNNYSAQTQHPGYCFDEGMNHTIELITISNKGCKDTLKVKDMISLFPSPTAGFEIYPETLKVTDTKVSLTNISQGANKWFWTFGDGDSSDVEHPQHLYPSDTATYTITQIVENNFSCKDTTYRIIIVSPELLVYIPNAFTPNYDGKNDIFKAFGVGFIPKSIYIFDRWGDEIYENHNADSFWDGTIINKLAKQDVYYYLIEIEDYNGNPYSYEGTVTLLRKD